MPSTSSPTIYKHTDGGIRFREAKGASEICPSAVGGNVAMFRMDSMREAHAFKAGLSIASKLQVKHAWVELANGAPVCGVVFHAKSALFRKRGFDIKVVDMRSGFENESDAQFASISMP